MSNWTRAEKDAYKIGIEKGLAIADAPDRRPTRFIRGLSEFDVPPGRYKGRVTARYANGDIVIMLKPLEEEIPF